MNSKILFVDDDLNLLSGVKRSFRLKYELETATSAEEALTKLTLNGPFAVVVSDRQMPGMDGTQFLSNAREKAPDTVRVMLTGNVDLEQAVNVVNQGNIFRFLIKPCPLESLASTLDDALAQHRLITSEKELLNSTLNGSIKLLTDILSVVDPKSFGRGEKLCVLLRRITTGMALTDTWEIHAAAMLGSIGLVTVPAQTVLKARSGLSLTQTESQLMRSVPDIAARLLNNIPRLEGAAEIARFQHKQFDGRGFPDDQTRGEAIPRGARLLKILNDLLDLQSNGKISMAEALDELSNRQGFYDQQMLTSIKASLGLIGGRSLGEEAAIAMGVYDLTVGMVLNSDVMTREGTLILSAGHHINAMVLEKLQNFKLLSAIQEPVYVRSPHHAAF